MDRAHLGSRSVGPAATFLALAVALATVVFAFPSASHADVSAVQGSAYGYRAFNISIFGGAQPDTGPTPTVTLAADAANSPQSASASTGEVVYGPATLFSSGAISVTSQGSVGPDGSVTSSTDVANVNRGGSEVFDAERVQSTCTASETGVTASTTITGGTLRTHSQGSDLTPPHDEGIVTIPANPPVNHSVEGHVHLSESSQDSFRYVFNEQITNPDGSITVNAVHAYLLGPTATGDLIIGQSVCGVATGTTTPTTTVPTGPTTTTVPTGPTTTTVPPTGPTTTTVPGSPTPPPTTPPAAGTECPEDPQPAPFADRDAIPEAHRANVDCAATLDVIRGFEDNTYRPRIQVRRDQMASFIARSLEEAGVPLPPPTAQRFTDVPPGSTHDDAIHRLAAAGIVQGGAGGGPADTYGPALRVRRDQMASFLVRAVETATGQALASQTQAFADVPPNNPHFANVNGAAAAGLAQGFGDNTFRPAEVVRRDQMASFIARLLTELASTT